MKYERKCEQLFAVPLVMMSDQVQVDTIWAKEATYLMFLQWIVWKTKTLMAAVKI